MGLALIFAVATIACSLAPSTELLVAARTVLGLAVGGASVIVPVYLAEMSPAAQRGRIVTQNELMIVTGQFLAFTFNAVLGNAFPEASHVWRWMLVIATLPAVVLWFGMLVLPESPRWLASAGRFGEVLEVLRQTRAAADVSTEFDEVRQAAREDYQSKLGTFRDLTVPWIRRIFVVGLGMAVINQISGVNAIMYYGTSILSSSGFGDQGALIANVVNGVTSVVAVIVGMSLMTRVPRKSMLIVGPVRHGVVPAGHRPDLDADPGKHPPRLPGAAVHGDVPGLHAVLHRHRDVADHVRNLPAARPRHRHGHLRLRAVDDQLPDRVLLPADGRRGSAFRRRSSSSSPSSWRPSSG